VPSLAAALSRRPTEAPRAPGRRAAGPPRRPPLQGPGTQASRSSQLAAAQGVHWPPAQLAPEAARAAAGHAAPPLAVALLSRAIFRCTRLLPLWLLEELLPPLLLLPLLLPLFLPLLLLVRRLTTPLACASWQQLQGTLLCASLRPRKRHHK
jgi:hypothetical protein